MSGWSAKHRYWALFFALVAIVGIILLAAALRNLELAPGQPLPRGEPGEELFPLRQLPGREILMYLWRALLFLMALLLPVALVYVIVSRDAKKQVLRQVLRNVALLLPLFIAFYFLARTQLDRVEQLPAEPLGGVMPAGEEVAGSPAQLIAEPPRWIAWPATLALAALIAVGFVGAAWYVWRRSHRAERPLEKLAREAQEALVALQAGAELKDTVMRCYLEMSRIVRRHRGIRRAEAMTPREFAAYLAKAGLPEEHVQQLTRLFEAVRYGTRTPSEQEARQAIDCLAAIVEACRSSA